MKIIFVRHCETEWNKEERCQGVSDLELNSAGVARAKKLKGFFKDKKIDHVFCSDLKRAKQTLNEINYDNRFNINYSEDLREMNQGDFEGLSLTYLKEKYSNELRIWRENPEDFRLPNGETLGEVRDRSLKYIKSILVGLTQDSTILVVTHDLVIASVLCTISNKELKFFTDFTTESGSISEVSFLNGVLSLEAINFTDHLKVEDKIVRFSEG